MSSSLAQKFIADMYTHAVLSTEKTMRDKTSLSQLSFSDSHPERSLRGIKSSIV